jgi:hypothetical protein
MRKQKMKNSLGNKRGVSMIVALTILSIISIVALTSTVLLTSSVRTNTEFGNSIRADAAAESGINLGLLAVKDKGVGVDLPPNSMCFSSDGDIVTFNDTYLNCPENGVQYSITGQSQNLDESESNPEDIYIIPPPGQGNAGENCVVKSNYYIEGELANSQDLPCNWAKLHYGESVQIPLYIDTDGPEIPTPAHPLMDTFTLKVRTPCVGEPDLRNIIDIDETGDPEAWCEDGRYLLHDEDENNYNPTDVIVNWQIIGDCDYDVDSFDGPCVGVPYSSEATAWYEESDITVKAINFVSGDNKEVLNDTRRQIIDLNTDSDDKFDEGPDLSSYLTMTDHLGFLPSGTASRTLNNPVLHLSVVSPLINADDTSSYIPYIEYQLETNVPVASSFQAVSSTGMAGDFIKTLKSQKPNETTNIEFVLQN